LTSFFACCGYSDFYCSVCSGRALRDGKHGRHAQQDAGLELAGAFIRVCCAAPVLMILFRQKYPRWWFDWNLALSRFCYRISVYLALMRDEYPSTDEEQAVHVDLVYPDCETQLMRGMPLIKWFLAIPHCFVLCFLGLAAWICIIIAWFAILFTGKYPRGLFDYVQGVMRWSLRVESLFNTDDYG